MKNVNHTTKFIALFFFFAVMGVSSIVFGQYGDSPTQYLSPNAGQYYEDAKITKLIKTALLEDSTMGTLKTPHINVTTMHGSVQLSGSVESRESDARAVEIAKNVPGVISVSDKLVVR